MRIRVAPKGRVERVDQRARLGGILSPVWYSVAMISSLLGLLLKKRLPLRQPCRGREPFAQVLAAIVPLVIATVAAIVAGVPATFTGLVVFLVGGVFFYRLSAQTPLP